LVDDHYIIVSEVNDTLQLTVWYKTVNIV